MEPTPDSNKEAIRKAVQFCLDYPTEKPVTGARIYGCEAHAVRTALARLRWKENRRVPAKHGGHNKILSDTQEAAVLDYITTQAVEGLGATKAMVFAAIAHLRISESPPKPAPSWRWFQLWMRSKVGNLHTLKTKPISRERQQTHTEEDIERWFVKLRKKMEERGINRGCYIHNFDETGVRVGCPGWEEVVVPTWIKELYTASPENRKSLTVIESISADGRKPPPAGVICPGKRHMENWYHENLEGGELVHLSPTGYTNELIALDWLRHFIKHVGAGPDKPWRLLLMDSHGSHENPDFVLLALENHIEPFTFPSHMTHILQPLDVGVFRPWKHWHKMAIQAALRSLDFDYNIASFMRDLTDIRKKTFKESTIQHAFKEAGIWPISCKQAIKKMR